MTQGVGLMWNNVIGDQIRRTNRNLLVLNLVVLLMVMGWLGLSFRSLYNQFMGPVPIDAQGLMKIDKPQKLMRYYFKIDQAALSPPIYRDLWITYDKTTNKETGREVRASYQLMVMKGGVLLVRNGSDLPEGKIAGLSGALVPIPPDMREKLSTIAGGVLSRLLLPTMFDASRFKDDGGFWPLICITPPLLIALWNIKRFMARREDFLLHPICTQLKKYGDPRELGGVIEQEVRDGTSVFNLGGLTITKNWMLSRHPWGMEVRKLDDLVWTHRLETTQRVDFVPVGKTQQVLFYFSDKGKFSVMPSRADCDKILAVLAERAPAAIYGFNAEVSWQWQKSPDAVIAQVKQNKEKLKEQAKAKKAEQEGGKNS
jgi:hypothetical protein